MGGPPPLFFVRGLPSSATPGELVVWLMMIMTMMMLILVKYVETLVNIFDDVDEYMWMIS